MDMTFTEQIADWWHNNSQYTQKHELFFIESQLELKKA